MGEDGGEAGGPGSELRVCRSDKACVEWDQLCESDKGICVDCLSDADCSGDHFECLAGVCSEFVPCASTKDCGDDQVCDKERQRCVECVGDNDCGGDQVCRGSICRDVCSSDKDCRAAGLLCDTDGGFCVECAGDADCGAGESCSDSACVPSVCAPGATACLESALATCRSNGSGFQFTSCAKGCVSGDGPAHCKGDKPGGTDGGTEGTCSPAECTGENYECDALTDSCLSPFVRFDCSTPPDRQLHRDDSSFNAQGWLHTSFHPYNGEYFLNTMDIDSTCDGTISFSGFIDVQGSYNWGAELVLPLCEEAQGDDEPGALHPIGDCPLPGDQGKIRGVRFTFCGDEEDYPSRMYVTFPENGESGAYKIISNPKPGQTHTVMMTDPDVRIHWQEYTQSPSTIVDVTGIGWNIPARPSVSFAYSVCVTDIELLGAL